MEVLGYTKQFDNDLRINKILRMKYEDILSLNKTQFATYYSNMSNTSAIDNLIAKRTLGYQTLLDELTPGSSLYDNLSKFNFGVNKLVSNRMLKGMRMAPQTFVGSRGSHKTLFDFVDDLKLDVVMDEVAIVNHHFEDDDEHTPIPELRGLTTENDYSGQTSLNIDMLPLNWENYPLKTGLVAPIVVTDLNYTYNFENIIEALILDKHPFVDTTMSNSLTVKENYAIVSSINKIISGDMHESVFHNSDEAVIYMHTYLPFIGSKFFIRTICTKYDMPYTSAVEEFLINFFARIDYSNPIPEYDLLLDDDMINDIIDDIKNKSFFYDLAIYTQRNYTYKDQYMLVNDIPGASDDLYSRLTELIMLKQYGLMWFKLYSRNYNLTMQFYKYILDNAKDNAKIFDESTVILESIKELYNKYFRPIVGPSFNEFEFPIRPKVAALDFINNISDIVPFYIKLLEISPVDRINTRIVLDNSLFGGTKLSKHTYIHIDVYQDDVQYINVNTINLLSTITSESTAIHNGMIYFDSGIYFKSTNNSTINLDSTAHFKLAGFTTIDYDHSITWFSEIVLNETTKDTWDMFVVNINSDDVDPDSAILDNWKVIDTDEHDLSVQNFEYEFPITDKVTGLTTRGKHTDFRFKVKLSSIGESADDIGVVIARNYSISEKSLTVVRSNNDLYRWRLIYNWGMHSEHTLIDSSSVVTEVGDDATGNNYWNVAPDGVNIIVERLGSIIRVNTSTWNDNTIFNTDSIMQIDIENDDFALFNEADLADVLNNGSIGFSCRNIPKVRFTDITFERIFGFSI